MFIDVLLQINAFDDKTFLYEVPSFLTNKIELGKRVKVPFGKRTINGIIINIKNNNDTDFETKNIIEVIDNETLLNKEMINLGKYMSETYICSLMSCYQSMIPSALKFNKKEVNIKYLTYIKKINDYIPKKRSETNILNMFKETDKILKSNISNKTVLKELIDIGILKEIKEEQYRLNSSIKTKELNKLTNKQEDVYNYILNSKKQVCLLRGVTGSGKTEIYMHLIKNNLNNGKTSIILVPEISLTTQLIERFRNVFGNNVAILHSSLSDGERYDEWRKIKRDEVKVVIGTRSAIFAPISNLGLIVIDEEQEDTYKQENNPRYKTIDIAMKRAEYNNAKIVLGSATPSLESYARSKVGIYDLVELEERINNNGLPKVLIIDMKEEIKKRNPILSKQSKLLIQDRLDKKEQIMILINRRGYSNYVICNECGEVIKCPNCDISLTYHKNSNSLKCHYCNHTEKKSEVCPKCNSKHLILKGTGTEKIEELLKDMYKESKIIRMDRDTTSTKGSHEKIINDFNNNKYDILLGTQMIAKGLDFDNVTLVIVLNGDASLNIPDYRSAEKTFELLTQVAGRSGRSNNEGIALIQTYNPDHYSIELAKKHDYISFYNKEIQIRKRLNYPPFTFIVAIRLLTKDFELGNNEITKVNNYLKNNLDNKYTILGPTSSLKINNIYKFQCIIKYKDKNKLYKVLNDINKHYKNNKIKLEIDFSPLKI